MRRLPRWAAAPLSATAPGGRFGVRRVSVALGARRRREQPQPGSTAPPHAAPAIDEPSGRFEEALRAQSTEELLTRVMTYNKHLIPREQATTVRALLAELCRRMPTLAHRAYRDLVIIAHAARLPETVLEVFRTREQSHATDVLFSVVPHVVDAAYALEDVQELGRLAELAARKVQDRDREVAADVSCLRVMWRLHCLTVADEANGRSAAKLTPHECTLLAEKLWARCVMPVHQQARAHDTLKARPQPPLLSFDEFNENTRRFVLYNREVDMGEMHFFRFCKSAQLLRFTLFRAAGSPLIDSEMTDMFFQMLLRTCQQGNYVDVATEYFEELQEGRAEIAEFNFFSYLNVLTAAKDAKRIVSVARDLLQSGSIASFGPGIIATLCSSAGQIRDREVATALLRVLLDENAAAPPTPFAVFAALVAVAKCHDATLPEFIEQAMSRGLISNDREMLLYLELMNGMWAADPLAAAASVLSQMREHGVAFTQRLAHVLLKIYLRAEAPDFIAVYRHAVDECGLFRREWLDELVLWADRRRYDLTPDEREFILAQVRQRLKGGALDLKGAMAGMEGVRTHVALLAYDHSHEPCRRFLADGTVTPDPLVRDSRVHFLLRKGARAVKTTSRDTWLARYYQRDDACRSAAATASAGAGAAANARPSTSTAVPASDAEVFEWLLLPRLHDMQMRGIAGLVDP